MLLIEAATISGGGGYGLLKLLIEGLTEKSVPFRIIAKPDLSLKMVAETNIYRKNIGLLNRRQKIKECIADCRPSVLLCFSNFPPPARYPNVRAITYFHRVGLIEQQNTGSNALFRRVKYGAMANYLRMLLPNTDLVICQSDEVAKQFLQKFRYDADRLRCLPFYNEHLIRKVASQRTVVGKKEKFIYVSDGAAHKNHRRLLKGWEILARNGVQIPLLLTLKADNKYLEEIKRVRTAGGHVELLGVLPYEELLSVVADCQYAIYPSLQESLGLGLVEAAILGVSVLAADLPYTYKAIQPSETFDPLSPSSVAQGVVSLLSETMSPETEVVLENRLTDLVDLLAS